jgi:DNA-binding response OmpR family regulator
MELEQLKIKFLTNLSHELKTPLTLILNPIENLLFKEKNSEKVDTLNLINRNAKRLLNIVNQLLDFRKIEENELKLNTSEGDLVAVAKEIFDSFKYISDRKHIHLDFYSSLIEFHTIFDKDKVERILLNLLSNAIKFTNENGKVYFHIQPDAEYGIKLIVGDTGIGLPAEKLEKIFDRFYQVNNQDNILNQGSGIGLSITQEFVKLHGGTINVESIEGRGSIFTVVIPLLEIKQIESNELLMPMEEEINQPAIKEQAFIEPSKIEKPIVLLVDDSEDIRIYLRESLKDQYRIVEASDGMKGWQKALSSHPEIIVSDISMPNMDGISLVKKLKNDNRTKHIPVILLTVLAEEIDQLKGLQIGANDYLTKPFNFQLLNLKICNLLALNNVFKDTYTKQISIEIPKVEFMSEDEKYLLKISQFIEDYISNPDLSVTELSKKMNTSRGTMYSKILSLTGETPVEFIRSIKLKKAAILLENSDMKISHIAYEVGFSNPNYFTRAFKAKYNISPSEYILLKRDPTKGTHHSVELT